MILVAIACAVVAACCFASAVALQHAAVRATPGTAVVRSRRWLAGLAFAGAGAGLHVFALSLAPLAVVQPVGVLSLVVTVVFTGHARGARVRWAVAAVCAGVVVFVMIAALGGGTPDVPRPGAVQFAVLAALALAFVSLRVRGRARCLGMAAPAAVLFGLGAALIRAVLAGADLLLLGEAGLLMLVGGWLLHQAYAAGPTPVVVGAITVLDPLTAVTVGIAWYGEAARLTGDLAVAQAGAALLAVGGVVALAGAVPDRRPVPVHLPHTGGLRILIGADTYPPDVNGAANFAARLADGLAARGHDVHIVCPAATAMTGVADSDSAAADTADTAVAGVAGGGPGVADVGMVAAAVGSAGVPGWSGVGGAADGSGIGGTAAGGAAVGSVGLSGRSGMSGVAGGGPGVGMAAAVGSAGVPGWSGAGGAATAPAHSVATMAVDGWGGSVTVHRVSSVRTPFHPTFRVVLPWRAARAAAPLVEGLRPDVVHVQSHFFVGRALLRAAVRRGVPVVATNHFMPENLIGYAPLPRALVGPLCRLAWRDLVRVFRHADAVTAPTPRAAELLVAQGFPGTPRAVSCGVDIAHYAGGRVPGGPVSVLFVGRLDAEKNVGELVEAVARVPGVRADIVGDGACRSALTRLAAELGVAGRVRFHGFVSDGELVDAYRQADVFCMPGTAELQSLATMEAMCAGLPVLAADAMALPHLVRQGVNGFRYPPGDVEVLATHLARLAADPDARAAMGAQSRRLIATHDIARTLDTFDALYREVNLRRRVAGRPGTVPVRRPTRRRWGPGRRRQREGSPRPA